MSGACLFIFQMSTTCLRPVGQPRSQTVFGAVFYTWPWYFLHTQCSSKYDKRTNNSNHIRPLPSEIRNLDHWYNTWQKVIFYNVNVVTAYIVYAFMLSDNWPTSISEIDRLTDTARQVSTNSLDWSATRLISDMVRVIKGSHFRSRSSMAKFYDTFI